MKEMPRMNARPYIKRGFKLLGEHKPMVLCRRAFPGVPASVCGGRRVRSLINSSASGNKQQLEQRLERYRVLL